MVTLATLGGDGGESFFLEQEQKNERKRAKTVTLKTCFIIADLICLFYLILLAVYQAFRKKKSRIDNKKNRIDKIRKSVCMPFEWRLPAMFLSFSKGGRVAKKTDK